MPPPAPTRRALAAAALLLAVAVLGAWLRFCHLDFGRAAPLHPDEGVKVRVVERMRAEGTLRPGYALHPPFTLHATRLAVAVADAARGAPLDRPGIRLAGRGVVAALGSLTVLATAWLAWSLAAPPRRLAAVLAAGCLAVAPLHVVTSHYLKEDVPLAFWTTLAVAAGTAVARGTRGWRQWLAAAAAGAAFAAKYVGGLLLVLVPLAALAPRAVPLGARCRAAAAMLAVAAAVAVAMNPFPLLGERPWGDIRAEARHASAGHDVPVSPWQYAWTYHLRRSVVPGLGWPVAAAAAGGCALLAWRRDPGGRWVLLVAATWYLVHEASPLKPEPNLERYMVPLLPLLCAAAGVAAAAAVQRAGAAGGTREATGRPRAAGWVAAAVVGAALLVLPARRSLALVGAMVPDTRERAVAWCRENLPAGSRVLLTSGGPALPRDVFRVWPRLRTPMPGMQLNLRNGRVHEEEGGATRPLGRADFVVVSSFWLRRFEHPGGEPGRRYYAELDERWGPPIAVFAAAPGPYAFHNPTLRVYRRPAGAGGAPGPRQGRRGASAAER